MFPKRLFISKSIDELHRIPAFCGQNGMQLHAQSFLEFEAIPFEVDLQSFDLIFFPSPRSVYFFMSSLTKITQKIAVAGESTQRYVQKQGINVHFCPKNSGNIEASVQEFTQWIEYEQIHKILFPCSTISQQSYTASLQKERFLSLPVYRTHIISHKIPPCDYYLFTSPSNVSGFFAENKLPESSTVIAWGQTTYKALKTYLNDQQIVCLNQASEESSVNNLYSILKI